MDRLFHAGAASFCCESVLGQKRMQPIGLMDCIFKCAAMCCLLCLVEPSLVASVPVSGESVFCNRSFHSRCKSAFTSRVA
jgi:hypothetical protein